MKEIRSIEIVFENCETAVLRPENFGFFHIGGIVRKFERIACNSIAEMATAEEVYLEIFKNSVKKEVFQRLHETEDITSMHFTYGDGSKEGFYVLWSDENEFANMYQKNYISGPGHLYIVIHKTDRPEDAFDMEEINNPEEVNFRISMVFDEEDG